VGGAGGVSEARGDREGGGRFGARRRRDERSDRIARGASVQVRVEDASGRDRAPRDAHGIARGEVHVRDVHLVPLHVAILRASREGSRWETAVRRGAARGREGWEEKKKKQRRAPTGGRGRFLGRRAVARTSPRGRFAGIVSMTNAVRGVRGNELGARSTRGGSPEEEQRGSREASARRERERGARASAAIRAPGGRGDRRFQPITCVSSRDFPARTVSSSPTRCLVFSLLRVRPIRHNGSAPPPSGSRFSRAVRSGSRAGSDLRPPARWARSSRSSSSRAR